MTPVAIRYSGVSASGAERASRTTSENEGRRRRAWVGVALLGALLAVGVAVAVAVRRRRRRERFVEIELDADTAGTADA